MNNINALLDEVEAELPKGVAIAHLHSVNDFLYASINEVIKTLIEAILLVILVVYVFLQDIRSTLIPTVSVNRIAGRYVRLPLGSGLLDQPADALRARPCDRYGRRRRPSS